MSHELKTIEGETLTFATHDEMLDYVISRMVEKGQLKPLGRNEQGDMILQAQPEGPQP